MADRRGGSAAGGGGAGETASRSCGKREKTRNQLVAEYKAYYQNERRKMMAIFLLNEMKKRKARAVERVQRRHNILNELNQGATKVQAVVRGHAARKRYNEFKEVEEEQLQLEVLMEHDSAQRIQAAYRAYRVSSQLRPIIRRALQESQQRAHEREAAITIQSHVRGMLGRREAWAVLAKRTVAAEFVRRAQVMNHVSPALASAVAHFRAARHAPEDAASAQMHLLQDARLKLVEQASAINFQIQLFNPVATVRPVRLVALAAMLCQVFSATPSWVSAAGVMAMPQFLETAVSMQPRDIDPKHHKTICRLLHVHPIHPHDPDQSPFELALKNWVAAMVGLHYERTPRTPRTATPRGAAAAPATMLSPGRNMRSSARKGYEESLRDFKTKQKVVGDTTFTVPALTASERTITAQERAAEQQAAREEEDKQEQADIDAAVAYQQEQDAHQRERQRQQEKLQERLRRRSSGSDGGAAARPASARSRSSESRQGGAAPRGGRSRSSISESKQGAPAPASARYRSPRAAAEALAKYQSELHSPKSSREAPVSSRSDAAGSATAAGAGSSTVFEGSMTPIMSNPPPSGTASTAAVTQPEAVAKAEHPPQAADTGASAGAGAGAGAATAAGTGTGAAQAAATNYYADGDEALTGRTANGSETQSPRYQQPDQQGDTVHAVHSPVRGRPAAQLSARGDEVLQEARKTATLRVHIATWNMNYQKPESAPEELLPKDFYHVYCVATQCNMYSTPAHEGLWLDILTSCAGPDQYRVVASKAEDGVHLAVLVHVALAGYVTSIATGSITSSKLHSATDRTELGFLNNAAALARGACVIGMKIGETKLAFVSCHMPVNSGAYEYGLIDNMKLVPEGTMNSSSSGPRWASGSKVVDTQPLTLEYDCVMWAGDFAATNSMPIKAALPLLQSGRYNQLWPHDSLHKLMEARSVSCLANLMDPKPHFPPTEEFKVGTDEYTLAATPSWRDRILITPGVTPLFYDAVMSYRASTHKPVVAAVDIVGNLPKPNADSNFALPGKAAVCPIM